MNIGQVVIMIVLAFLASTIFTSIEIPILRNKQMGQNIREEGPQSHMAKAGTPSMGGVAIILAIVLVSLIGSFKDPGIIVLLLVMVLFGLVGFLDDYIKVIRKNNLGLRAWQKIVFQLLISAGLAVYMAFFTEGGTLVYIPFADTYCDFGGWYIPFIIFVVVAMTNSVNLTDGLDGLASGITALVAIFFAIAASNAMFAVGPARIFCAAIAGACLGFLVWNKNPAKVFMGDTGSLGLGGALAVAAITMKMELFLPIAGLIYVLEALSVILQVASFKLTGKRIFKMAPLHHHFEESGMGEKSVVVMFWAAALICCIIGFGILKF